MLKRCLRSQAVLFRWVAAATFTVVPLIVPHARNLLIMLVLSRKIGQEVRIGENVTVVVLEATHSRVKLGFVAPVDVRVNRAERGESRADLLMAEAGL